jgi:hypothetical protein
MAPMGEFTGGSYEYSTQHMEQSSPVFPSGEISLDYSWTQNTIVIVNDRPREASTTFRTESFARERGYDCVVISYEGSVILPFDSVPLESGMMEGTDFLKIRGTLYFAYKEGLVILDRQRWTSEGDRIDHVDGKTQTRRVTSEADAESVLVRVVPPGDQSGG